MKIVIEQIKNNKWIHYAIIIFIGLIVSISLFQVNIRNTHDGFLHLLRLIGTDDAIQTGQIPPIIAPNYCNATGYAMNLFYPPLATYLPLVLKLFTPTYIIALKLFGMICIILSGITMYKFTNEVTNKKSISLFAAVLYIIAPYKLANVYIRYAIGEFIASVFIPLVFLGIYNLFNKDGKKHYYIAIGATGLMLSHTISTFYTALFCIIYIMFFIKKLKEKEIIKKCAINVIFILLMSAMFLLPMYEATKSATYSIMVDRIMGTDGAYTSENTIEFSQFVEDIGEENGTTFVIGIPMLLLVLVSVYGIFKTDKKWKEIYIIFLIFSLISIIMCTKFFPWSYMPNIICKLQYPWRMLGYFIFFASLLCAINLQMIIEKISKKENIKLAISIISILIMITFGIQTIVGFVKRDDEKTAEYSAEKNVDEVYENSIMQNKRIGHMQINREYLPYKALILQNTYMKEREDRIYVLEGSAEIESEEKIYLELIANIKDVNENTILEFPYIFYPGYEITINNIELKPEESENGYLSAKVTQNIEQATIKVEYKGTLITKVSYVTSIISIIAFIVYLYIEIKRNGIENVKD